jgi:hypothetical protein
MSGNRARASFAVSLWVSPGGTVTASPHISAHSCRQSPVPSATDARSAAPVSSASARSHCGGSNPADCELSCS